MTVGERLREARKAAKLSGEKLGEYIQVSKAQISNIEKGTSDLTYANALVLSEVLGVSADWLLTGKESGISQRNKVIGNIGNLAGRDVRQTTSSSDCEQKLAAALNEIEHLKARLADKEEIIQMLRSK